jgi:surface polysaccharide O-acyltransferase-like enzyme
MLYFVSESLLYLAKEEVYFFHVSGATTMCHLFKNCSFRIILAKVTVFFSLYSLTEKRIKKLKCISNGTLGVYI